MNEAIGYIFGTLHNSEVSIRKINRVLISQRKFNKWIAVYAVISCVNIWVTDARYNEQQAEIESLKKEVEELKRMKGE